MSYELYGKRYENSISLAKEIYLYPRHFYHYLQSVEFLAELTKENEEKAQEFIELKKKPMKEDLFLFYTTYLLNPYLGLRYHHFKFKSLEELGEIMLSFGPTIDVYLEDLLHYHLLSFYLLKNNYHETKPKLYGRIKELEEKYLQAPNFSYWLLAFELSKSKVIIYNKVPYFDPKDLFKEQLGKLQFVSWVRNFELSNYVEAWLTYRGYERILDRYHSIMELIEKKEELAYERLKNQGLEEFDESREGASFRTRTDD